MRSDHNHSKKTKNILMLRLVKKTQLILFSNINIAGGHLEIKYTPIFKFIVTRFRWKNIEKKRESGKNPHVFKKVCLS